MKTIADKIEALIAEVRQHNAANKEAIAKTGHAFAGQVVAHLSGALDNARYHLEAEEKAAAKAAKELAELQPAQPVVLPDTASVPAAPPEKEVKPTKEAKPAAAK